MEEEKVVLVDTSGNKTGLMSKMEAHKKGKLHKAFSLFIFNDNEELLLQKRASHKYHSPNLWSNTCCSHPRDNENILDAGKRRLKEEMGFECSIEEKFSFIYKEDVGQGLIEHEYDYVLVGNYNKDPIINLDEVSEFKWESLNFIKKDISENPNFYTIWFKIILKKYLEIIV